MPPHAAPRDVASECTISDGERFPPADAVRWKRPMQVAPEAESAAAPLPTHVFSICLAGVSLRAFWYPTFILIVVAMLLPFASSAKCIPIQEIGVNHTLKRYIIDEIEQRSLPLTLAYAGKVSQRLSTAIFKIYLEEVIGYQQVVTVKIKDYTDANSTFKYLESLSSRKSLPVAMINTDLWLPPGFSDYIEDSGSQGTGARYGWYVRNKTQSDRIIDHWRSFLSEDVSQLFALSLQEEWLVKTKFTIHPNGNYFCPETFKGIAMCREGLYVPRKCQRKRCATLFAGDFNYSSFLPSQVEKMELLVQIAWIGPNLTPEFLYNFRGTNSIMFFSWWPDHLSVLEDILRISFPLSIELNKDYMRKYEFHSIRKKAWIKLKNIGQLALETLNRFSLEERDYRYLLHSYNYLTAFNYSKSLVVSKERLPGWDDKIIEKIACDWLSETARLAPEKLYRDWPATEYKAKTVLWIAGIFPVTDIQERYASRTLLRAAGFAEIDINADDEILKDYELRLYTQDGGCNTHSALYVFINYFKRESYKQMAGILGPGCSSSVEPLAGLAKRLNVVIVSYSAEGAMLNDYSSYPTFFRTIPENILYRYVYLELFKELKWKHIASLTEDGNNYSEYLTLLQNTLQDENISIFNRKIPRGEDKMSSYLKEFKEKNNRIIIGDFYIKLSNQVICEASKMGMTAKDGFIWFLPRWLPNDWYNTSNKSDVNCTTEVMLDALDGHLSLGYAYFAPEEYKDHKGETVAHWKRRYQDTYNSTLEDYSGYTYDAMWTYAMALDRLMKENFTHVADLHSNKTGRRLIQLIRETNFRGISGQIVFGDGPSRKPTTVHIMQFHSEDRAYRTVGHFYPQDNNETAGHLELNFTAFKWFTPDGLPPGDGSAPDPQCALESIMHFMGISCEFAIIITMLTVFVAFVLVVIILFLCYRARYEKINHCRWQLSDWANLQEWEIPKDRIVTNRVIGEGAFGTVYGGECMRNEDSPWDACAVKTLKPGSTIESKLDFLSEAEMMKRFDHENVVQLIGLSTRVEPLFMIMEFLLYGNLKTYLLGRRHLVSELTIFGDDNEISNRRLTSMALDVAKALEYLATSKYVHRDVACRNCLVSASRQIKLSDFGMTRKVYEESEYRFNRKGWLPLRWMAPESLQDGIFTTMTDMWSYGVLLYEIITFGNFPFQNMSDSQVLSHVKGGGTLRPPVGIRRELERILFHCWRFNPDQRPSFSDMVEIFSNSPRLIMPCLEVPLASVETTEPDNFGGEEFEPSRLRIPPPSRPAPPRVADSCNSVPPDLTAGESGYGSSRTGQSSLSSNKSRTIHFENGNGPVMEPLLLNSDNYVGKYACLELARSPDGSERECPLHQQSTV